jgi:hypothetical protein
VNLFLIGWSRSGAANAPGAEAALAALLVRLPFFGPEQIRSWQAASGNATLAYVAHDKERVGGVGYVDIDEEGMALFSGRPFRWTGDGAADGRAPLDPRFYRRPAGRWMADLDGRFGAARYGERERELDVYADPLGAYPLFSGELDGTRWISNSAELVRTALGTDELDPSVVASVLGAGYSLSGDPVWAQVKRLPRGTVMHLRVDRPDAQTELLPLDRIAAQTGSGLDPDRAARDLVAATGALADWPGRPTLLQLSGGRDSRLVLAAALAAGAEFDAVSTGTAEHPDVRVARLLSEQAGVRHRLLSPDPDGALHRGTRDMARVVGLAGAGTLSIETAAGYPIAQSTGPLPLWLGGQGGEIARAHLGSGDGMAPEALAPHLFRAVAGSAELLSATARERLEREVRKDIDDQLGAGVAPVDIPDLFFLFRMSPRSAVAFGCVEYGKGDSITPLWSRRLLRHQLGAQPAERARERFHAVTLEALSPPLAHPPFVDYVPPFRRGSEEFVPVFELAREAVWAQESHPAWEVLEPRYVEQLLALDPTSLEEREQRHVWRLASVFMNGELEQPA